jgi:HAD superfamily hydrolase (TIGR01509 family)
MTRAALFDIDGTLLDSVDLHARAWQEAFARFGVTVAYEDIRSQIGKGGDQIVPFFLTPEQNRQFGEQVDRFRSELFRRKYLPQVRPFPKVRELFEALRAREVKIALASSAKADELQRYLELARIADLVEASTSSDDAERSKPHPDIFAVALERLGHPPVAETVAVGDSPYDAQAAGRLGIRTVGVLCGGFPEEWLRAAGCAQIFRDPADLLERLDDWLVERTPR